MEAHGVIDGFGLRSDGPVLRLSDGQAYCYGQACNGAWELDLSGEIGWRVVEALPGIVRAGKTFGDEAGALPLYAVWCNGATIGAVRDLRRRLLFAEFVSPGGGWMQLPGGLMLRRVQAATHTTDETGADYWQTSIATVRIPGDGWAQVSFDREAARSVVIIEGYETPQK